jgi:predicted regulator of Ras-like GTPase activity (Roadblock/LC7/MglB family)
MRQSDLPAVVDALRIPLDRFVREARVRIAILATGAGQILAQHGFGRGYEIMNVASLAAAAHASSRALAELSGAGRWQHLYHAGIDRQLFLAPLRTPGDELILVAIFDADSSLGIITFFYDALETDVAALPQFRAARSAVDQASFERDLEAGLEFIPEGRSEG